MSASFEWEAWYRAGDAPWEKGYAAPPLMQWLDCRGPLTGRVLVPGCGFGHDARAVRRLLKPDGRFLAVFFLNPRDPGELPEGPPFGTDRTELDGLFGPWFKVAEEYVPSRSYPGREGRELVRLLVRCEG